MFVMTTCPDVGCDRESIPIPYPSRVGLSWTIKVSCLAGRRCRVIVLLTNKTDNNKSGK